MDDNTPGLEIGFAIDTGGSFEELVRLRELMGSAEAQIVAEAAKIERATGGMVKLGNATAQVTAFGNAHSREAQNIVQEAARIEKAGERLVRQLERENGAFGKSRAELRQLKAEEAALAAERVGNSELASRIRAQEADLWGKETMAARQAAIARQNAAEDAAAAEARAMASVNAQLIERNRLEAALERNFGVNKPRATDAGATYSALAARAAEEEARAVREAAFAYQMFEARARQGVAAMKAAEAAERDLAARAHALRAAIDPTYAAQEKFNQEIAEARALIAAGAITLDEYSKRHWQLQQGLKASAAATRAQAVASGQQQQAMQQLYYQANDVATQWASNTPLLQIFAQQSGQVFQALGLLAQGAGTAGKSVTSAADAAEQGGADIQGLGDQVAGVAEKATGMGGKLGLVAGILSGPFGAAAIFAVAAISPFVAKLFEGNKALDDAVAKLKKDAEESLIAAKAQEKFKASREGLNAAIRDQVDALKKAQVSQTEALETASKEAVARANLTLRIRQQTAALIDQVKAQIAADLADTKSPDMNRAWRRQHLPELLADLEGRLGKAKADVAAAQEAVDRANVALGEYRAKALVDPIVKINEQADAEVRAAKAKALASHMSSDAIANEIAAINRRRDASIKAEQERQQAVQRTEQVGREIDLAEARRIALSIGARITSEQRSYEEQKRLYDKYMAYKAGKGPWAALAAAPGTSDHELGNALDIAKTPGMSLAKIREAFRAAGVSIKQLLDEGSHFHVSWKRGADSAAAASKKLADVQADLAKRFDPAESAAIEYREALKSIADAKLDPATAKRYADEAADAFRKARAAAFELPSMAEVGAQADSERAAEKSAEEFQRNVIKPLKDELALYGLIGPAREAAALALEKEAFLAANMGEGLTVAMQRWQEYYDLRKRLIDKDAAAESLANDIRTQIDLFDELADVVARAGSGMADAFGNAGRAMGDLATIFASYRAQEQRADDLHRANMKAATTEAMKQRELARHGLATSTAQIGAFGDMASAAKGFFAEGSKGYKALETAEKTFRAIQFALSLRAIAQDAIETGTALAKSAARAAAHGVEAVAKAIASLPFPLNLAAGAATAAAIASLGISIAGSFGGGNKLAPTNTGTGTVLGDPAAKSDSLKNAIDALKEVDTVTSIYARQMAGSLKSIESQIGGIANLVVRSGDINASAGVNVGFKPNMIGSILGAIPLVGGLLKSLFGTTTSVVGSGLYAGPQSIGSILGGGFDASYYSDIEKKKKFLGITTGKSYSTQYTGADAGLEQQFALLLRSFNDAILAAAGPLGAATSEIQNRLNGFVVNLGKIDLKGLTGEQIQEKLSAVFGAAADSMANAAFPGIAQFQKVGEGAFETLVRVASTVEAVGNSLDMLGKSAQGMSIAAKLGLVDQFDSIADLRDAAEAYFADFYTKEEQTAAKTAQLTRVFTSLGISMPASLAAFRDLVEAQDLTTAAGQETYATLLKLAPAFADLQEALAGAKSAADVASERADLQRQLLQLQGNTAALRALDLAKLDASNRALQEQIWAIQDAQEAARAADELRQAWVSVGDSIMDEVKRIRGLNGVTGEGSFTSLMGQFNAATAAARAGDMEAAKSLPQLSQALLTAAAAAATSQQELARVQAQTAASLEATFKAIGNGPAASTMSDAALLAAGGANQSAPAPANDDSAADLRTAIEDLRSELAQLRADNNSGHAATAANTGAIKRKLEDVTAQSGGDAISTVQAA